VREAAVTVGDTAFEEMGIGELIALGREAGIVDFEELACHGTGAVVRATVESRYDEARLSALEYVDNWEYVAETDAGHVYVIVFRAPNLPASLADRADDLVGTCDPQLAEESATMSLVGPQEAISETIRDYEAAGIRPDLRKLGAYEGDAGPLDELTDRQREVLETAYDMGYFEVPRGASAEAIAAELDLDASTVVEHLQRAERNLLDQFLG
jgi:DNA-binding CsgD family transcriptional regulator